jgi:hypothetical protein
MFGMRCKYTVPSTARTLTRHERSSRIGHHSITQSAGVFAHFNAELKKMATCDWEDDRRPNYNFSMKEAF